MGWADIENDEVWKLFGDLEETEHRREKSHADEEGRDAFPEDIPLDRPELDDFQRKLIQPVQDFFEKGQGSQKNEGNLRPSFFPDCYPGHFQMLTFFK